jgi:histone-lysine N-methyltransferase SETMAR
MLIVFFDIQGIVHMEIVTPSQTANGKFYCEVVKWLREGIRRKHPDKWKKNNWFLHACSHITRLTVPDFQKHYSDSPPRYSPDLAPCNFFLFPKMKLRLKGHRFDMTEKIHAESQEVIDTHLRTSRDA